VRDKIDADPLAEPAEVVLTGELDKAMPPVAPTVSTRDVPVPQHVGVDHVGEKFGLPGKLLRRPTLQTRWTKHLADAIGAVVHVFGDRLHPAAGLSVGRAQRVSQPREGQAAAFVEDRLDTIDLLLAQRSAEDATVPASKVGVEGCAVH
jgi:hypothetical protein